MINIGQAENELVNLTSQSIYDNQLCLYSVNSQKLLQIELDDLQQSLSNATDVKLEGFFLEMKAINNNQFITMPGEKEMMFGLIDSKGNFLDSFGNYPESGRSHPFQIKRLAYQGVVASSPSGDKAV